MTVVADSSPLIFLGKIRRLALIHRLLAGEILVPEAVRDEVLAPPPLLPPELLPRAGTSRCRYPAAPPRGVFVFLRRSRRASREATSGVRR